MQFIISIESQDSTMVPRFPVTFTRGFAQHAAEFHENATELQQVLANESATPRDRYHQYTATITAANRLDDYFGFNGIYEPIDTLATASDRAAANVSEAPQGEQFVPELRNLSSAAGSAANESEALSDSLSTQQSQLEAVEATAVSRQGDWMSAWEERRNAPTDIYATIAAVPVLAGAIVGYRYWMS